MSTQATSIFRQIKKSNEDRQIIYAEVYAPNRLDTHGEMMLPEDVEKMCHRFLSQLNLAKSIDVQHDNVAIDAYPIESFIAREGDPDFTPGAWVMGVKIEDADVWARIKSGDLNGFSFQAMVIPVPGVEVEIETVRDHVCKTEENEGHWHYLFAKLDATGNIISGRTSKAADGHWHELRGKSVTVTANKHNHRFFL